MSAGWIDLAVEAVAAELAAELPAALRAIETANSLSTNSLTDPVAVMRSRVPYDQRSPLVCVYDESSSPDSAAHQRNRIDVCDLSVYFFYSGTVDTDANEKLRRRYMQAIRNVLRANPTLDGQVISVEIGTTESIAFEGPDSVIATASTMALKVRTHP